MHFAFTFEFDNSVINGWDYLGGTSSGVFRNEPIVPEYPFHQVANNKLYINLRVIFATDTYHFGLDNEQIISSVPEPSAYAMLGLGLGVLGFAARRRKSA